MTKDSASREKPPWSRENVTGFMYHIELTADTSYTFAVTSWNRWGESLLEMTNMLSISSDFPDRTGSMTCSLLPVNRQPRSQGLSLLSLALGGGERETLGTRLVNKPYFIYIIIFFFIFFFSWIK